MRRFLILLLLVASKAGAADAPHAVEVPFHDCGGLICLDVSLDGKATRTLLLDTGNVHSLLTTDTAKSLGWTLQPYLHEGKPSTGMFRADAHDVNFDGGKLGSTAFLVVDRELFGKPAPPGDGTLAYTFFKDRILEIDYPHHRLRVSEPAVNDNGAGTKPAAGTLQLINFGNHGPPILVGAPFIVDGQSVRAQIDTFFTGTLLIYDAAAEKFGWKKRGEPEFFAFTDGGVNLLGASAQHLGFGQTSLLGTAAKMYFVGAGANPVHQPDGLFEATVGNALFKHSIVAMDFHSMTLNVRPAG